MPMIKNNTRETMDFIVKGEPKGGIPPTDSIAPGETKNIDVVENAVYRGRIASGSASLQEDNHRRRSTVTE